MGLIAAFQQSSAASELTAVACGGVMPNWPEHTASYRQERSASDRRVMPISSCGPSGDYKTLSSVSPARSANRDYDSLLH